ncbi:MAG TPA: MGMT family protein [Puia sp.]|nr:MGMT family protein [Puia sp.]
MKKTSAAGKPPPSIKPSGKKEENFAEQVYAAARQIPRGRVTTFGAIATAIGSPHSARLVGHVLKRCGNTHTSIPMHRIVNGKGELSGRQLFDPPRKMQELLEKEGVVVVNDKVQDFRRVFWDPATEN